MEDQQHDPPRLVQEIIPARTLLTNVVRFLTWRNAAFIILSVIAYVIVLMGAACVAATVAISAHWLLSLS